MKNFNTFKNWLIGAIVIVFVLFITYPVVIIMALLLFFIIILFSNRDDNQRQKDLNRFVNNCNESNTMYPEIKPSKQEFESLSDDEYFHHYDFSYDGSRFGWYPLKKITTIPIYSKFSNHFNIHLLDTATRNKVSFYYVNTANLIYPTQHFVGFFFTYHTKWYIL